MIRPSIIQVETPTTIAVVKATLPGFTAEQAFDAWTQPEKLTAWWPQRVALLPNSDSAVGAEYILEWPLMKWTLRGTYLAWERPRLLTFTWKWDHEPDLPMRTVVVQFGQSQENRVSIVIVHGTYSEATRDREDRQSHIDGWLYFMEKLSRTAGNIEEVT
ncbi:MAG: hypothetical protein Fur0022_48970 [Anaerolineales bacterium]